MQGSVDRVNKVVAEGRHLDDQVGLEGLNGIRSVVDRYGVSGSVDPQIVELVVALDGRDGVLRSVGQAVGRIGIVDGEWRPGNDHGRSGAQIIELVLGKQAIPAGQELLRVRKVGIVIVVAQHKLLFNHTRAAAAATGLGLVRKAYVERVRRRGLAVIGRIITRQAGRRHMRRVVRQQGVDNARQPRC